MNYIYIYNRSRKRHVELNAHQHHLNCFFVSPFLLINDGINELLSSLSKEPEPFSILLGQSNQSLPLLGICSNGLAELRDHLPNAFIQFYGLELIFS